MPTVTDGTRKSVWEDFNDSEYYTRYYSKLADKYRKRHFRIRYTLLGIVLIEATIVIPLMSRIPEPYWILATSGVGLMVVALTVFDAISNDATNAAKLTVASDECRVLHTEWRELWVDIGNEQVEENVLREKQRALLSRTNLLGTRVEINEDKSLNEDSALEANEIMRGQYAKTA